MIRTGLRYYRRFVFRTTVIALMVFVLAQSGAAQVHFEPDVLAMQVKSGKKSVSYIVLTNDADVTKKIVLSLEYRRTGVKSKPIETWAEIIPRELELKKGRKKKIKVVLKGKEESARKECVLALFAGERRDGRVPLDIRVGMPVFVRWNGEKRAEGKIGSISQQIEPGADSKIEILVKNTGVLHIAPYGIAWVEGTSGERVWQIELRPDQPIFPGETKPIVWQGQYPKMEVRQAKLGIQLFWGTLYGLEKVGIPKSEIVRAPLKIIRSSNIILIHTCSTSVF